jgi:hypothetical protein
LTAKAKPVFDSRFIILNSNFEFYFYKKNLGLVDTIVLEPLSTIIISNLEFEVFLMALISDLRQLMRKLAPL